MGRKNRRAKYEYRDRLGFNPSKYIGKGNRPMTTRQATSSNTECRVDEHKGYVSRPYRTPYRGEVWFAELGTHPGTSVQDGCRPVLIVSNDRANHYASTIVVLPMTSRMKKSDLPSHVELCQEDLTRTDTNRPLEPSMVLAEQVTTIGKTALRNYIGKVTDSGKLAEIDDAVKAQLGISTTHTATHTTV